MVVIISGQQCEVSRKEEVLYCLFLTAVSAHPGTWSTEVGKAPKCDSPE